MEIESVNGVDKICKAAYKKNDLTMVSNAHSDFQDLLSTKRDYDEIFVTSNADLLLLLLR